MAINSKSQICNMATGHLGDFPSVSDIDVPTIDLEITYSLWYDISRQAFLKMTMPNFALARKTIAIVEEDPPFPFSFSYRYPADCLKILGIGNIEDRDNDYTVEGERIYTNQEYPDGLPIRYIKDIEDVSAMSPEFKMAFSLYLAAKVCMDVTQDLNKKQLIEGMLPTEIVTMSGLNAQENLPIRISKSNFREARYNGFVSKPRKR